jgi:hypothetical protein
LPHHKAPYRGIDAKSLIFGYRLRYGANATSNLKTPASISARKVSLAVGVSARGCNRPGKMDPDGLAARLSVIIAHAMAEVCAVTTILKKRAL